ncbi:MAG: Asp-tRNA(Asn)/Glu-tRNA(Gln) amidotransferase subunit GatB [Desulfobacteraceae bacterium]
MDYEPIICFEVHAELSTRTKLFCGCRNQAGAVPNSNICPVCTGHPGTLPVLNRRAVALCIRAGLALNCEINHRSRFARKNYFYPDLPKGYQISQYETPFCENGYLDIPGDDGRTRRVGIKRIHLEEDAGKLVHSSDAFESAEYSLVDFNRASVPLIEIVGDHTRDPIRSVHEARAYLEKLRQVLRYAGVSECSMEKGQFRCDVNISLRPKGATEFGNRSEIKNMASFRFVAEALDYEISRQADLLKKGLEVPQETRLFDEERKVTLLMRGKEDAPDYRYFPEPDLVETEITPAFAEEVEKGMPELPDHRVSRLVKDLGLPREDALILTRDKSVSDFFDRCAPGSKDPRRLCRWIVKDLFKLLNDSSIGMEDCLVEPEAFTRLVNRVSLGEVTEQAARMVLQEIFKTGKDPDEVIEERGLHTIQDSVQLEQMVDEVLSQNPSVTAKIKEGNKEPINYLVGQVMRRTSGRADASKVVELFRRKIAQDR